MKDMREEGRQGEGGAQANTQSQVLGVIYSCWRSCIEGTKQATWASKAMHRPSIALAGKPAS